MEYRFTFKGILPNLNDYTDAQRTNKYNGAKMKRDAQSDVAWAIKTQMRGIHITKPVFIEYTFYEPNRRRDKDNISGFAHKVIQDALVQMKVLKDDGWDEIVGFSDNFGIDKKTPRIEVILKEVEL